MNVSRRGLLGMFAAATAAPFVPAQVLMPVRKIIVPEQVGLLAHIARRGLQDHINRQYAVALSAIVMREGQLHSVEQELTVPGGILSLGDELRGLRLQPGDQVLSTVVRQAIEGGTGWMKVSARELPWKGWKR